MRIAIIGAGFSGLSAAWHLLCLKDCEVVLFDSKGIGGGASGVAAGLLHPYVGEEGKRSDLATEGIAATKELVKVAETALGKKVASHNGILRHIQEEEKNQLFLSHCQEFKDVTSLGEGIFCIESGLTIDCPQYLEGLWLAVAGKGAKLILREVWELGELAGFDHIIVAAGAGVRRFPELRKLCIRVIKGQVLHCRIPETEPTLEKSAIGKGYVAISQAPRMCYIGSTYERGVIDEIPDVAKAKSLLFPKIGLFFPSVENVEIVDCKAALRVIRSGHYFPIVERIKDHLWVFTAMGSRGLLYHAYLGKLLAEALVCELQFGLISQPDWSQNQSQ